MSEFKAAKPRALKLFKTLPHALPHRKVSFYYSQQLVGCYVLCGYVAIVLGDISVNIRSHCDKFTKPLQLVKQYIKTSLSIYRLSLYNHDIQCIIAIVFYGVDNKKDYITSVVPFQHYIPVQQGHSKIFTTGQASVNSEHYVIKCMGKR